MDSTTQEHFIGVEKHMQELNMGREGLHARESSGANSQQGHKGDYLTLVSGD